MARNRNSVREYRILIDAVINSNHIKRQRFLKDVGDVMFERMRDIVERHGKSKSEHRGEFNGEFCSRR